MQQGQVNFVMSDSDAKQTSAPSPDASSPSGSKGDQLQNTETSLSAFLPLPIDLAELFDSSDKEISRDAVNQYFGRYHSSVPSREGSLGTQVKQDELVSAVALEAYLAAQSLSTAHQGAPRGNSDEASAGQASDPASKDRLPFTSRSTKVLEDNLTSSTDLSQSPTSILSRDDHSASEEELPAAEDVHSEHLKLYTSMDPQPPLPSRSRQMLDTWSIGTDPASLDGGASTRQVLFGDTDTENQESEASQTRKAKRRKKDKRTAPAFTDTMPFRQPGIGGSQPLPFRNFGSQPLNGSSQLSGTQGSDMALISTQPEPGRHGRRPAELSRKKKKRKEGF